MRKRKADQPAEQPDSKFPDAGANSSGVKIPAGLSGLQIEDRLIDEVKPYDRNARTINEKAVAKVAASIQEFGWQQPIVVDSEGVIIAGHTRWFAAGRLKLATVPVVVARNLSPAQVRAYRIADNRTHQETAWDLGKLFEELTELEGLSFDLKLTGFDVPELESIMLPKPDAEPPAEFPAFDDDIETEHKCPSCGYEWSGKAK